MFGLYLKNIRSNSVWSAAREGNNFWSCLIKDCLSFQNSRFWGSENRKKSGKDVGVYIVYTHVLRYQTYAHK